jgi:hypothetical protein
MKRRRRAGEPALAFVMAAALARSDAAIAFAKICAASIPFSRRPPGAEEDDRGLLERLLPTALLLLEGPAARALVPVYMNDCISLHPTT